MNNDELITLIKRQIDWLDANITNTNAVAVTQVCDKLSVLSFNFGDIVTQAYELMNQAEDDYKLAVATFKKEFKGSVARSEVEVDVACDEKRRLFTQAKNVYKRLNVQLERIDKILDSRKQSVSVLMKTEGKRI